MSKGSNSRKNRFLNAFVKFSLEDVQSDITCRCKFNFSYFDTNQEYGADLATWDEKNLQQFYSKLKSYSAHPLSYWQQQNVGSHRNHVLEIYGGFPKRSGFVHPSHVPSDVDWARFRLDGKIRLVGFTIPKSYCKEQTGFDYNTFYIVFLDPEHKFYLSARG
ncbi:MAG: hypothetical protein RBQ89_03455 [Sphaerochaeta sp.]|jgi:hypothetical protein|nr:hypothetical protein [Sphaerochaeta sp.]MDY0243855.1 hypothetical protein [Sphaerochaeta sp.]